MAALHGDRTQGQRERALDDLRRGRVQVLVATDIASRGIDVDDISHVVNYDVPRAPEDYVHRIGRTGRVQATGDAFTLMSPEERPEVAAIERFLGRAIPRVLIPDFDYGRAIGRDSEPRRRQRSSRGDDGSRGRRKSRRAEGVRTRAGAGSSASNAHQQPRDGSVSGARPRPDPPQTPRPMTHGRRVRRNAPDRRRRRM